MDLMQEHMVALYVKPRFAEWLVSGKKQWEIRSKRTARRGKVHIIQSGGKGSIIGHIHISDCKQIERATLKDNKSLHCIQAKNIPNYQTYFAWVIDVEKCEQYRQEIKVPALQGCVTWRILLPNETQPLPPCQQDQFNTSRKTEKERKQTHR